jgi:hypothetical protein
MYDALRVLGPPTSTANWCSNPEFIRVVPLGRVLARNLSFWSQSEHCSGPDLACCVERMCTDLAECFIAGRARYMTLTYGHTKSQLELSRRLGQRALTGESWPDPPKSRMWLNF